MRRRICAECGLPLVAEGDYEPGAEPCPTCGAARIPAVPADAGPVPYAGPAPYAEPVEVRERVSPSGDTYYREVRQGPFVFKQYGRTLQGNGAAPGCGCGCGCLLLLFILYLILRGFVSLF